MNKPKFRAWDKDSKKVYEVEIIDFKKDVIKLIGYGWTFLNDIILMQYTGLKDKNGKLYCQNDLVRYKGKIYRLIKGTYTFELVGFYESYQDNPNDFFSEQAYLLGEIVGDFYTNPELLNEVE